MRALCSHAIQNHVIALHHNFVGLECKQLLKDLHNPQISILILLCTMLHLQVTLQI